MQNNECALRQASDARRICEILGLDFDAIANDATKAIPEPKSWVSLREETRSDSACRAEDCTTASEADDLGPHWIEDDSAEKG